jgi:hypothetical protein
MDQKRILQAVGITIICLFVSGFLLGLYFSFRGISIQTLSQQQLVTYFFPLQVIAQFVLGGWLGRKVDKERKGLFSHVFLANMVLFLFVVLFGFFTGQSPFWIAAFAPMMALILSIFSYPMALFVRKKG